MIKHRTHAYTLMELLVVISIITLLIAMLLPSLSQSKRAAKDVLCKSQIRQVALGFDLFSVDNRAILPGVYQGGWVGPEQWQKSWMGQETWHRAGIDYDGTILRYISGGVSAAQKLYRCPDLAPGILGSGVGSNGDFDYTSVLAFSGASIHQVPKQVRVEDPITFEERTAFTPLVVEEDPNAHVNNCCIDPGHSNVDRIGQWHPGGSNFATLDGHVESIKFDGGLGPTTWDWTATTPSGTEISLTALGAGWGAWAHQ